MGHEILGQAFFWVCLWRCFWMRLTSELVNWVKSALPTVGGAHPVSWNLTRTKSLCKRDSSCLTEPRHWSFLAFGPALKNISSSWVFSLLAFRRELHVSSAGFWLPQPCEPIEKKSLPLFLCIHMYVHTHVCTYTRICMNICAHPITRDFYTLTLSLSQ